MSAGVIERVDLWTRRATPVASGVLVVLFGIVPWPLPAGVGAPMLGLVAVFFWSFHRPEWFPPLAAFLLGLLHDIMAGGLFGLSALLFVLVHWIVGSQRRRISGRSFMLGWLVFTVLAGLAAALSWALVSAYHVHMIAARPVMAEFMLNMLVYPPVALVLAGVDWLMIRRAADDAA